MTPPIWKSFVAVGDSFTEGMCDPEPEPAQRYAGWADRLAGHLSARAAAAGAEFRYANLAVRGRKLGDIVGPQLDAALAMAPELVSIVGGGNDILRPTVDLAALAQRLEDAVVRARTAGADVLLATPSDTVHSGLFKPLRPRHAIHTANLFTIAARHGAHVVNLWQMRSIQDWRMWADDRIHLTSAGHERVALAALESLGFETNREEWLTPLPPATPRARTQQLAEHVRWGRTHFTPWLGRRLNKRSSGEVILAKRPQLEPLAPAPILPLLSLPYQPVPQP